MELNSELNKEKLILIWKKYCSIIDNSDHFTGRLFDEYLDLCIKLSDTVELQVFRMMPRMTISIIFGGVLQYATFELDEKEFKSLCEEYEMGQMNARQSEKDRLINTGVLELNNIILLFN